jgi:hypothetical protein
MNKREIFTLYVLNILSYEKSVATTAELYERVFEKHEREIFSNYQSKTWKRDCYRAIKWLVDREMLIKSGQLIILPELAEIDTFEVDEFTVHIYEPANMLHARLKGDIPMGGQYSARIDKVPVQDHVHVYKGQNQICSMNADGSGHDGYTGTRLPNKVVKAIKGRNEFKNFKLPPNNVLTLFSYPLYP